MSNRVPIRRLPTNDREALEVMFAEVLALRERVAELEARPGSLPGDYRFEVDDLARVTIRRVSSDLSHPITPTL